MQNSKVNIATATLTQLNFMVALGQNHQSRCYWLLEQQGYRAWQGYEMGHGNPIPDYCSDWAVGGPLCERLAIMVSPFFTAEDMEPTAPAMLVKPRWQATMLDSPLLNRGFDVPPCTQAEGESELIAKIRCYCIARFGESVQLPVELMVPGL